MSGCAGRLASPRKPGGRSKFLLATVQIDLGMQVTGQQRRTAVTPYSLLLEQQRVRYTQLPERKAQIFLLFSLMASKVSREPRVRTLRLATTRENCLPKRADPPDDQELVLGGWGYASERKGSRKAERQKAHRRTGFPGSRPQGPAHLLAGMMGAR